MIGRSSAPFDPRPFLRVFQKALEEVHEVQEEVNRISRKSSRTFEADELLNAKKSIMAVAFSLLCFY